MNDELTAVDIKKMEEEIRYRQLELRPKILEDVKTAREFGDLSENFEYKAAKQEKRRNDSRIRYLERMIKTAKVIGSDSKPDEIGLFDKVVIYIEEDDEIETYKLVTPEKAYASIVLTCPEMKLDATYTLAAGTDNEEITLTDIITTAGTRSVKTMSDPEGGKMPNNSDNKGTPPSKPSDTAE